MDIRSYIELFASAIGRDMELSGAGFSACTVDGRQVLMEWHETKACCWCAWMWIGWVVASIWISSVVSFQPTTCWRRPTVPFLGLMTLPRTIYPSIISQHEFVLTVRNMMVFVQLWKDRLKEWREELCAENVKVLDAVSTPPVLSAYSDSSVSDPARRVPFWQFSSFGMLRHRRQEATLGDKNIQ